MECRIKSDLRTAKIFMKSKYSIPCFHLFLLVGVESKSSLIYVTFSGNFAVLHSTSHYHSINTQSLMNYYQPTQKVYNYYYSHA